MDQLESNTPGLIAQLKGKLTQQRYKYATVFVDQFSGYTLFVYLQKRLTSEETVMAKHDFEHSADQHGVKITHYHADNSCFADNAFITDCKAQRQGLSYCGGKRPLPKQDSRVPNKGPARANKNINVIARPGQIVSVDQLESNTPGLIAQLKGKLTQQRYKYATVFVDQFSGYTLFVYLQKRLTSEETVMAKHDFEHSADQHGVKITHYHADNSRFADNAFITDCKAQRQGLSYCGGKRPLPKQDSRVPNKGPAIANKNINVIRYEQMEMHDSHLLMALCHASCQRCR